MSRSVIGDDRGPIVVGAEVQSGAGILPDVDLVGEPADFLPCPLTAGSCLLDFIGYRAATTNLCLGMRHRKPRDLARDRPALCLVGIQDCKRRPAIEVRGQQPEYELR